MYSIQCLLITAFAFLGYSTISCQKYDVVKVTVYYNAYEEDSQDFFKNQLKPAYDVVKDKIILDLVPHGKSFPTFLPDGIVCLEAESICSANIIQACAFQNTTNQTEQFTFADCVMENGNVTLNTTIQQCATKANLSYDDIVQCSSDESGYLLYLNNGFKLRTVFPPIFRLPTVTLNGFDVIRRRRAQIHLLNVICNYLNDPPEGCPSNSQ